MQWTAAVIIFGAGFCAGMINSVAGGGTLLSFPTLVWLGRDPILANATNAVALWPGSLAAMFGFRRSLSHSRRWLVLLGIPSVLGGLLGAILLLRTPSSTFSAMVPWLILLATVLLAAQEPIGRALKRYHSGSPSRTWWAGAILFQFLVALYGGYFGAGIGIMMLAALSLLRLTDIYQMNGLKNFFAVCINAVAAVWFAWSGAVLWSDAIVMALGAMAGGYGGAGLARKAGPRAVRLAAVLVGFGMAVSLLLRRH
jgi:uncharacterized membrane protein YfcA